MFSSAFWLDWWYLSEFSREQDWNVYICLSVYLLRGRKNNFPSILLESWLRLLCQKRQIHRRKPTCIPAVYKGDTQKNWITFSNGPSYHLKYQVQQKTKERCWGKRGQLWEVSRKLMVKKVTVVIWFKLEPSPFIKVSKDLVNFLFVLREAR